MAADTLFVNVRLVTGGTTDRGTGDAVAVSGQRIAFVGPSTEARQLIGPRTRVIDGRGGSLLPGFIDSHFHLLWGSLGLGDVDLRAARSLQELGVRTAAYLAETAQKPWVVGRGLSYNIPSSTAPLTRFHLDDIISDRPFFVSAYDYHTIWANTTALQAAGLLNGGASGPNSEIVMFPDGTASGELREPGAYGRLLDLVPPPNDVEKMQLLKKGLALTASLGITSVHNMDGNPEQGRMYAALEDREELSVRVYLPFDVKPDTPYEALQEGALAMKHALQSDMLRAGAVKFFMDGVLESYTAYLVDPYDDDQTTRGATLFEPAHFQRMAVEADRLGLQIFVHACGDGAVREVLNGYEAAVRANGRRDGRHRVEHIELIHPDDLPRFAALGVAASMQPLHAPQLHLEDDVWPARAGVARWGQSFAWSSMKKAGARLAFGSDWPVVSSDPLAGVGHALNRRSWGGEGSDHYRLSLREILAAYTVEGAYAEFQEKEKGVVKENYLADLVLLDADLLSLPAEEVARARPRVTMCGGRIVYEGV